MGDFEALCQTVRGCQHCSNLGLGPKPIFQLHPQAKILIAGQAPGAKTHAKGIPFDDASGERLRDWLGLAREQFYDAEQVAILPMAFCYPGKGKSGDLSPPKVCAELWRQPLLAALPNIELTLVIGQYAMDYHLPERSGNLTQTVSQWRDYTPKIIPLPHPSPRNNIWLKKNPWFNTELLPYLKRRVEQLI